MAAAHGRDQVHPLDVDRNLQPRLRQHGRHDVDGFDWLVNGDIFGQPGRTREYQRHPDHRLVEGLFLHEPMLAEHVSVVGREDNEGAIPQAGRLQRSQNPTHRRVDLGTQIVVVSPHLATLGRTERAKIVDLAQHFPIIATAFRPSASVIVIWQVDCIRVGCTAEWPGGQDGSMRCGNRRTQEERRLHFLVEELFAAGGEQPRFVLVGRQWIAPTNDEGLRSPFILEWHKDDVVVLRLVWIGETQRTCRPSTVAKRVGTERCTFVDRKWIAWVYAVVLAKARDLVPGFDERLCQRHLVRQLPVVTLENAVGISITPGHHTGA